MGWINGGYMVLEPQVIEYIKEDIMFESTPLETLAAEGQLSCYKHHGFWQCMDTMRDKEKLEKLLSEKRSAMESMVNGTDLFNGFSGQACTLSRVIRDSRVPG